MECTHACTYIQGVANQDGHGGLIQCIGSFEGVPALRGYFFDVCSIFLMTIKVLYIIFSSVVCLILFCEIVSIDA